MPTSSMLPERSGPKRGDASEAKCSNGHPLAPSQQRASPPTFHGEGTDRSAPAPLPRHAHAFLQYISASQTVIRAGFDAIDRREFALTCDERQAIAESVL